MNKKIISILLSVVMSVGLFPITTFAEPSVGSVATDPSVGQDTIQGQYTEYAEIKESAESEVYLTVDDSDLVVSLPTTVILDGTPNESGQYIGKYSVGVKGDMSGDKIVTVEPDTSVVSLRQDGKVNNDATISQTQTDFDTDDFRDETVTDGTITATGLTAGSWNSQFNFNINVNKINHYYSTLELAATDINNGTIDTDNTEADLYTAEGAACGAYKVGDTYRIEVYKDIDNQAALTYNKPVKLSLNNHTIGFVGENYITYTSDFSVLNGNITGQNTPCVVFCDKDNLDSTFIMNNVDTAVTYTTSDCPAAVRVYDISSKIVNISNGSIDLSGTTGTKAQLWAATTRNTNGNVNIDNFDINSTAEFTYIDIGWQFDSNTTKMTNSDVVMNNPKSLQTVGTFFNSSNNNVVFENCNIDIDTNGFGIGVYVPVRSGVPTVKTLTLLKNTIDICANNNAFGLHTSISKEKINYTLINCNINLFSKNGKQTWGVAQNLGGISNDINVYSKYVNENIYYLENVNVNAVLDTTITTGSARGLSIPAANLTLYGGTIIGDTPHIKENTGVGITLKSGKYLIKEDETHPVYVYGKHEGLGGPDRGYGTLEVHGGDYTSANHIVYLTSAADIYNAHFYVDRRDTYENQYLDTCYGLYVGGIDGTKNDYDINFYNCTIGTPGKTQQDYKHTICAKLGSGEYQPPANVNLYDCTLYQGKDDMFSYNTSLEGIIRTKYNVYDGTRCLTGNGSREYSKAEIENAAATWKTTPGASYYHHTTKPSLYMFDDEETWLIRVTDNNKIIGMDGAWAVKDDEGNFVIKQWGYQNKSGVDNPSNVYDYR